MAVSPVVPNFSGQLRYMKEWFQEFSPLQRADFLPILVESFSSHPRHNGLPPIRDDDALSEAPFPSIFNCRVKLILEWTSNWTHHQKWEYINAIRNDDPDFVANFLNQSAFEPLPPEEQ